MKTILLSCLATALVVSVACFSSGRPPGVAIIFTSACAAALAIWTFRQYERRFDPLPLGKPVRLPIDGASKDRTQTPRRLAA